MKNIMLILFFAFTIIIFFISPMLIFYMPPARVPIACHVSKRGRDNVMIVNGVYYTNEDAESDGCIYPRGTK